MGRANHIIVLLLSIIFWSCESEEPAFENNDLLGRWEIKEATRNGRSTESLDELFFEFFADGNMTTNLGGFQESATYEIEDNVIMQRESQFDVDYTIKGISDTSLQLSTQLRDYYFKFNLLKAIPED